MVGSFFLWQVIYAVMDLLSSSERIKVDSFLCSLRSPSVRVASSSACSAAASGVFFLFACCPTDYKPRHQFHKPSQARAISSKILGRRFAYFLPKFFSQCPDGLCFWCAGAARRISPTGKKQEGEELETTHSHTPHKTRR